MSSVISTYKGNCLIMLFKKINIIIMAAYGNCVAL